MVDALLALYASRGSAAARARRAAVRGVPEPRAMLGGRDTAVPDHAGISVPWVGREYAAWRVCVVGLNFDNYGGLAGHWRVCASHIRALRDGGLGKNGRFFATGAMSYARAVEMSMCGSLGGSWDDPSPADLARSWERCAYLQAVKCAPHGNRSQPTRAMCSACPSFLLKEELEILAPSAVILLGRTSVRDIVRPIRHLQPRRPLANARHHHSLAARHRAAGEGLGVDRGPHPAADRRRARLGDGTGRAH
jgi:hypothetical protein